MSTALLFMKKLCTDIGHFFVITSVIVSIIILVFMFGCDTHDEFHGHVTAPDTSVVVLPPPSWECPPADTIWVTTIIYCHWHRTKNGNPWRHCKEYCDGYKDKEDDDDN